MPDSLPKNPPEIKATELSADDIEHNLPELLVRLKKLSSDTPYSTGYITLDDDEESYYYSIELVSEGEQVENDSLDRVTPGTGEAVRGYIKIIRGGEIKKADTPISSILVPSQSTFQLKLSVSEGNGLTLPLLSDRVVPYLDALIQLQTIINSIRGRTDPPPILIKKIESNSPITVDITGITEAFQVLINYIVPWRRAHAHQSAELTLKQQEAQIADLEAQTKSKQTEVRKQRAEAKKAEASATAAKLQAEADAAKAQAEAVRIHAEAERLKAEATKLHAEAALLQFQEDKGRYELAVQIILQFGSHLPDQQKLTYITQLAGPLRVLTTSPLEPVIPPSTG